MIIVCPDCSARFVVKAEAIGEAGRKVKCAKCAHSWFQKPDTEALEAVKAAAPAPEPEVTHPIPEGGNVPAVAKVPAPLYIKAALAASVVLFLFGLSLINANHILPKMAGYYGLFGIYDAKDISLYDVEIKKEESGKYEDLVVKGKIVNDSEEEKHLPDLRLTLVNEKGKHLKTVTLDSEGAKIAPGEAVNFENRITRMPQESAKVLMDLGNSLDLSAR